MRDLKGFKFPDEVGTDFFRTITSKLIGTGYSRRVYDCVLNKNVVIKIEKGDYNFDNITEYKIWSVARNNENYAKWLAPCLWISPCGRVLIQERTYLTDRLPKQIPVWLYDTHQHNFGRLKNDQFVCHDYANSYTIGSGVKSFKMKTPKWRLRGKE